MNRFATPAAFRQSLEERVRARGAENIGRLRKRLAMERLLLRLQIHAPADWVLKCGVALELRLRERARATIDMDLGLELEISGTAFSIEEEIRSRLQEAAEIPGDDFFEFAILRGRDTDLRIEAVNAQRFPVVSLLGGRIFDRFQLDVAPDEPGSIPIELIDGSGFLQFAGIAIEGFRAVSRARHFAEKIHAYTQPREQRTRVKDLLDLLLLEQCGLPPVQEVRGELAVVFGKRAGHELPARLPDPPPEWTAPFEAEAPRTGLGPMSLDMASSQLQRLWERLGF